MTEREALKIALETLKKIQEGCGNVIEDELHAEAVSLAKMVRKDCKQSIVAIEEVLAQPEQEPVAWAGFNERGECREILTRDVKKNIPYYPTEGMTPLYITPPKREWVGLTDPEVVEAYRSVSEKEWAIGGLADARVFFCAIEAKLREKNGG